jgi:hypothetical protein
MALVDLLSELQLKIETPEPDNAAREPAHAFSARPYAVQRGARVTALQPCASPAAPHSPPARRPLCPAAPGSSCHGPSFRSFGPCFKGLGLGRRLPRQIPSSGLRPQGSALTMQDSVGPTSIVRASCGRARGSGVCRRAIGPLFVTSAPIKFQQSSTNQGPIKAMQPWLVGARATGPWFAAEGLPWDTVILVAGRQYPSPSTEELSPF